MGCIEDNSDPGFLLKTAESQGSPVKNLQRNVLKNQLATNSFASVSKVFLTVQVTFIHIVLVVSRQVKQTLTYKEIAKGDYRQQHYKILTCIWQ